ncbi:MAG TPA: ABC transporter permease, partial [Candidatus Limnocylindrales bacterium]|nr:ABC transporter permease [Candidatus Limnocylindrales bacterium]
MSALAHEVRASYAFIERNFFLSRRYWGWELAFLVYSAAGALSISLIGAQAGDPRLLMTLIVGATFWNYLSVVFSWIAETIQIERWEGTLEYTFMAPVHRSTHLLGAVAYAMIFGLIHTAAILVAVVLFFPELSFAQANVATIVAFMLLGSFSLVGVAMLAAILPLLFVERGMQMAFVLQSVLLLISGVYYSIDVLPGWMQALSHISPATYALDGVRKGLIDGVPLTALWTDIWPLLVMGALFIPLGLWAFGRAE